MANDQSDLLQGTLAMFILEALRTFTPAVWGGPSRTTMNRYDSLAGNRGDAKTSQAGADTSLTVP